jgi:hypothetical protein
MATGESALPEVAVDVRSVTLGELAAVELASGQDFDRLLNTKATKLLTMLYIAKLRESRIPGSPSFGQPPRWADLAAYRLLDGSSSSSAGVPDGAPTPSSDSPSET